MDSKFKNNEKTAVDGLVEALEMARNGIVWYMENSDQANGCDDDALEEIDKALLRYRASQQEKHVPLKPAGAEDQAVYQSIVDSYLASAALQAPQSAL